MLGVANDEPLPAPPMSGERQSHPAGLLIGEHCHVEGQLSIVLRGTMNIHCPPGGWLAPAGWGIWIPPGVEHAASYSEDVELVLLRIPEQYARQLAAEPQTLTVSDLLRELALEICRLERFEADCKDGGLLPRLILRQLGYAKAVPTLFLPGGHDPRLTRVMERLRRQPALTQSLVEMAAAAGCSRRTLARLFIAETGMSFSRWREHLRVVTALDRLARGTAIARVALDLGYCNPSGFTTMFTRVMGMPPARYLRRMMNGDA